MRFTPKTSLPISDYALINSCNGLLCLSGPGIDHPPIFVCNPIIGEYITIPGTDKGRPGYSSVGLGFSVGTNEYNVVQSFKPVVSDNYVAEIYTIGTGVWKSIGNAYGGLDCQLPFNAYLRGALHWVSHASESSDVSELIYSFDFEREQFRPLPPPSYFGPREKQFSDCLKLGVLEGCLVLCVFGDDSSKFDMWVMKHYGVQESWTKTLVIENLYDRELSCDLYEPMVYLSNGEVIMSYNDWIVVCYNQKRKSLRGTKFTRSREFRAIGYNPCFVSLYDVAKAEEVKRVQGARKCDKPSAEGSSGCAGSGMPPHKSAKLDSGHDLPTLEEGLPRSTSSAVSPEFSWRIGTAFTLCGGDLGYLFRGKGFPTCQQCFDAGSM